MPYVTSIERLREKKDIRRRSKKKKKKKKNNLEGRREGVAEGLQIAILKLLETESSRKCQPSMNGSSARCEIERLKPHCCGPRMTPRRSTNSSRCFEGVRERSAELASRTSDALPHRDVVRCRPRSHARLPRRFSVTFGQMTSRPL